MFKLKEKVSQSDIFIVKEQRICHVDGKRREEHCLRGKKYPTEMGSQSNLDLTDWMNDLFLSLELNVLIC